MDLRQLEAFVAVAQEKNFTRAAARLHIVQSAVSATIALLEADLDTKLFERTTRATTMTDAGRALLPEAIDCIASFRRARDAVEAVRGGLSGAIILGYLTSITLVDVPRLLGQFSRDFPRVRVTLNTDPAGTAGLADRLRAGTLDLAVLGASPADHPDLNIRELASAPLRLIVPEGHWLAEQPVVSLRDLGDEVFVDSPRGFGNRTAVDDAFARAGVRRSVHVEAADINDAAALVQNGLGIGFLPDFTVRDRAGVRLITISEPDPVLVISIASTRSRPPSAATRALWNVFVSGEAAPPQVAGEPNIPVSETRRFRPAPPTTVAV